MFGNKVKKIFIMVCLSVVLLTQFTSMNVFATPISVNGDGGAGGSRGGPGGGGSDPPTQHIE